MEEIIRRIPGRWARELGDGRFMHPVYTEEEAREHGLPVRHWRDPELVPGEFGLTDDGYAAELLGMKQYEGVGSKHLKFSICRYWTKSKELLWEKYREAGSFYLTKPQTWIEAEAKRPRTRRAVDLCAAYIASGQRPNFEAIGRVYRPDEERPDLVAKQLLRMKTVALMVNDKIAEILARKGITQEAVIEKYEATFEEAHRRGHTNTMKSVADVYRDMLGMNPERHTREESEEIDFSHEFALEGGVERKQITAKRRRLTSGGDGAPDPTEAVIYGHPDFVGDDDDDDEYDPYDDYDEDDDEEDDEGVL
jgi:hypothetical protein